MNDFTKEELKWLANSITIAYYSSEFGAQGRESLKIILNKILPMIDNYTAEDEELAQTYSLIKHKTQCLRDIPEEVKDE